MTERPIKVVIAKTSLDGHWRGPMLVTTALREAGMEVVYLGMVKPTEILDAAIQEDADVVGLNIGGRYYQVKELLRLLQENKVNALVVAGGTIPREDISLLKDEGVDEVFPPGSSLESIVGYIRGNVGKKTA